MIRPTRSIYSMSRDEIAKGIANRFVHSRAYIMLYLVMAALSITTVVLSMVNGCPGLPFYVLEFIINTAMILEVSIRFIAFGRVSDACPTMTLLLRLPTNSSLLRTPLLGLPSNATLSFCLAFLGSPTNLPANHQPTNHIDSTSNFGNHGGTWSISY